MRTGFYQIHDIGLRSSYLIIKNSAPQQPILWSSIALHCEKKMNGSHSLWRSLDWNICRNSQCSNTKSTIHKNYKLVKVGRSSMRDSQYMEPVSAVNHQRLMSFQFYSNIRNKRSSELVREGQLLEWSETGMEVITDINRVGLIWENQHCETKRGTTRNKEILCINP